jgi:hypothetical protein
MRTSLSMTALATLLLMACSPPVKTAVLSAPESTTMAADAFFARLHALCGKAYAGRLVAFTEADAASFGGTPVMHVRECSANEIRIPFHVGEDRSRTWVVTRTASGLRLKHDHRHVDGSSDALTMYGGDSKPPGTAQRQSFPVDADSVAMFRKADMLPSVHNTWAMDIEPDQRFIYELTRPGGRRFQVEFDLSKPVALPPAPWGSSTP